MRYNLALHSSNIFRFTDLAKNFDKNADYLLGESSYPHITLAQFRTDDENLLEKLWQQILLFKPSPLTIFFKTLNQRKANDKVWIELLPEKNLTCQQLHEKIISLLKQEKIVSLNASLENYRPHLTLARQQIDGLSSSQTINVSDDFYLVLGKSDEVGQLIEIIKK